MMIGTIVLAITYVKRQDSSSKG